MTSPVFLTNLRAWAPHVAINALPSFLFAVDTSWKGPAEISAMLVGVVLFWQLVAAVSSYRFYGRAMAWGGLARAFRVVKWVRLGTSVVGSCGLLWWLASSESEALSDLSGPLFALIYVDVMAGFGAVMLLATMGVLEDLGLQGFYPALALTLTEGVILLVGMLVAALVLAGLMAAYSRVFGRGRLRRSAVADGEVSES